MFGTILIANRGEIACRIERTARRLGIRSVAVFSDADANALHVRLADEAIPIGPAPARDSYLRGDAIVEAALRAGAEAIHPGYGFLSENEQFAEQCARAGLIFIGPPAAAIRAMGSKSAAKSLMQQTGVPLVPGYHGEQQSADLLQQQADAIGYPVLIKASAGGGGKGMRRVDKSADFAAALASCQREAQASFGSARVLIEKYVLRPRHIEIQVFLDGQGHGVYFFERDCSIQRRHQKVIEEAPAPGMDSPRRAHMGATALAAARAVGYVGAGTVEFIVAPGGEFYFMEMNTRLQVEHPVTEMITGQDLVEWQFRVAAGESLPLRQEQLAISGHAIEARIYAEDPDRGFLPATGHLTYLRQPQMSRWVRVDAGVAEGDDITPYYDPMIAKLIVWDESRAAASARLKQALAEFHIVGVHNNVQFLSRLVTTPAFLQADLDTTLIEREHERLFPAPKVAPDAAAAAAALAVLSWQRSADQTAAGAAVWRAGSGWRLNAPARLRVSLHSQGIQKIVWARELDGLYELRVGECVVRAPPARAPAGTLQLMLDGQVVAAEVILQDRRCHVFMQGEHHVLEWDDPLAHVTDTSVTEGGIRAPMPGKVVALLVQPGARVVKGEPLLVLEAMKMEHTTCAPSDGICEAFKVKLGEQVAEGAELVQFRDCTPTAK
ncbi:MAG TPA: acetyl/propionyl/methylcrotonyl-CoA carboxylase subunit alpha [Steroidobacteraceae bacterium]|jgi:3-methylcrotonyl-CoA carboxylase alpha subunit